MSNNRLLLRLSLCLTAFFLQPLDAEVKPLFDGKTFEGWEGETAKVWRIVDGVIVGGSLEGNPQNEFLATKKSYKSFVLKFEYKLHGTTGFVNGGMQFWSQRHEQKAHEMKGFQADIGHGYTGALCDEMRRMPNVLVKPDPKLIEAIEKKGEWNRYEVRCEGSRIRNLVNGKLTVDYTEKDPAIPLEGKFGLQIHGNCKAEISFRNLTIEELADEEKAKP